MTTTEAYDRRRHRVAGFSCGRTSLDEWLKRYAGQGERRDTTRTFVRADEHGAVVGYYVLVATEIARSETTPAVVVLQRPTRMTPRRRPK